MIRPNPRCRIPGNTTRVIRAGPLSMMSMSCSHFHLRKLFELRDMLKPGIINEHVHRLASDTGHAGVGGNVELREVGR